MKKKLTFIVPCYNEQEVLPIFYEKINEVIESMKNYSFEIIFVNLI